MPLLLDQPSSGVVRELLRGDPDVAAWWGTPVECGSALARLRREGVIDLEGEDRANAALRALADSWVEILPSEEVREAARRLPRVHPLRAGDALQLSAALLWSGAPGGNELVTFDERLALAARLEGFSVVPAIG